MPLGRLHKRILCKWLLYDGEETLKSWKPMLNTIFALRGSSECSVQQNAHRFFVPYAKQHCRADLLTPESYKLKKNPASRILFYYIRIYLIIQIRFQFCYCKHKEIAKGFVHILFNISRRRIRYHNRSQNLIVG